jgi:Domain of unknown function (DUF5063)
MNQKEILTVINDFIGLLEKGLNDEQANLRSLELILDRLALAYHFAEVDLEDYDTDAPAREYKLLRQLASTRFPRFGYYNEPKNITEQIQETELITGDSVDDVADIASDLYKVLWYWEKKSEKAALWEFSFGYEHHWGRHLRSLQSYLYELLYK